MDGEFSSIIDSIRILYCVLLGVLQHKRRWLLGLRPRPRWRTFQASPTPSWAGGVPPYRTLAPRGGSAYTPTISTTGPLLVWRRRPGSTMRTCNDMSNGCLRMCHEYTHHALFRYTSYIYCSERSQPNGT